MSRTQSKDPLPDRKKTDLKRHFCHESFVLDLYRRKSHWNSVHRRHEQSRAANLEHKTGGIDGFSQKYHCERLVYYEEFDQVLDAIACEKQLKGWRREKKIAVIESRNPRWEDLAEKWGWKMAFAGASIRGK